MSGSAENETAAVNNLLQGVLDNIETGEERKNSGTNKANADNSTTSGNELYVCEHEHNWKPMPEIFSETVGDHPKIGDEMDVSIEIEKQADRGVGGADKGDVDQLGIDGAVAFGETGAGDVLSGDQESLDTSADSSADSSSTDGQNVAHDVELQTNGLEEVPTEQDEPDEVTRKRVAVSPVDADGQPTEKRVARRVSGESSSSEQRLVGSPQKSDGISNDGMGLAAHQHLSEEFSQALAHGNPFEQCQALQSLSEFSVNSITDRRAITELIESLDRDANGTGEFSVTTEQLRFRLNAVECSLTSELVDVLKTSIDQNTTAHKDVVKALQKNNRVVSMGLTQFRSFMEKQFRELSDRLDKGRTPTGPISSAVAESRSPHDEPSDVDAEADLADPDASPLGTQPKKQQKRKTKIALKVKSAASSGAAAESAKNLFNEKALNTVKEYVKRMNVVGADQIAKKFIWKLASLYLDENQLHSMFGKGLTASTKQKKLDTAKKLLDAQCIVGRQLLDATITAYGIPKNTSKSAHLTMLIGHLKNHLNSKSFKDPKMK